MACTTYRSFGFTSAGLKVSLNACGNVPAGEVRVASGGEPAALEETSTRFSTRVALSEGCGDPARSEIVPLTSLGIVASAAALPVDAGLPLPACSDEGDPLQPARASTAYRRHHTGPPVVAVTRRRSMARRHDG